MTAVREAGAGRAILVQSLAAAVALAILIALGVWQLERKAWKETLIASLEHHLAATPVALLSPADWRQLRADTDEFLRVAFTAEFLNDKAAAVYTSGSTLRDRGSGPGYWVFTPARVIGGAAAGAVVMVNRGFVPEGKQNPASRPGSEIAGRADIVGVLHWPEAPGLFTPAGDPARNVWFARDSVAIAAAKGIESAAPFYVELESPEPPGGLPHAGRLHPSLPNNHLQYALTWFGLAAVLVGVYAVWLFGVWGRQEVARPGSMASHGALSGTARSDGGG